jgi:hypothetical protein
MSIVVFVFQGEGEFQVLQRTRTGNARPPPHSTDKQLVDLLQQMLVHHVLLLYNAVCL